MFLGCMENKSIKKYGHKRRSFPKFKKSVPDSIKDYFLMGKVQYMKIAILYDEFEKIKPPTKKSQTFIVKKIPGTKEAGLVVENISLS